MPILLDRSPFFSNHSELAVRAERVQVRPNQIIVWVSLNHITKPNRAGVPFPVLLDTGHNHTFSIQEHHLQAWGGLQADDLDILNAVRDRGQRLHLRSANIWIHPNQRGERDRLSDQPPYLLKAVQGIAIYPKGGDFPRLPILGLQAIAENHLILKVDGQKRQATLRTPIKWWPFT